MARKLRLLPAAAHLPQLSIPREMDSYPFDVVVILYGDGLALDHLVGDRRQGAQARPLLAEKDRLPAALPPLERPPVDLRHPQPERAVELLERRERAVPEGGDGLALDDEHGTLDAALVPGLPDARGHGRHPVVLEHAAVLLVDHELVHGVLDDPRLQV